MVVTKTLDAIAGSIFIFFKVKGTSIPNSPAIIIVSTIDIEMIIERILSWNQIWTIKALMAANIIPFNIPIENSLKTFDEKLFCVKSFVAIVLTVTANVCIPAFPPIEATIGIRKARTTICSIVAPNKLIHQVARKAVNKFNKSQLNLLLVFVTIPSVISSSPTPASLNASSSASSYRTVRTSSFIIIPTNLLFLSTTAAELRL